MANNGAPEQIKLPSPDELLRQKEELVNSAIIKLKNLGFTDEETKILTGTYSLFA